jgi:hypothetical protein
MIPASNTFNRRSKPVAKYAASATCHTTSRPPVAAA